MAINDWDNDRNNDWGSDWNSDGKRDVFDASYEVQMIETIEEEQSANNNSNTSSGSAGYNSSGTKTYVYTKSSTDNPIKKVLYWILMCLVLIVFFKLIGYVLYGVIIVIAITAIVSAVQRLINR